MKKLDFKNTNEDVVLKARCLSAYKGKLVIRMGGLNHRSFCFGPLFISKTARAGDPESIDAVKHEYGHAVQLKHLGLFRYIKYIAHPSVKSRVQGVAYFDQPWEVHADICGSASRVHDEETIAAGEAYITAAMPSRKTL